MKRTFGQLQQDLANNPVVGERLPQDDLEAGRYLQTMLDLERYEEFLDEFYKKFPHLAKTSFGDHCMGVCHLYAGNGEQARECLNRAVAGREASRDPRLRASYQALGRVLDILLDDYDAALTAFAKSLNVQQGHYLAVMGALCAAAKRHDEETFDRWVMDQLVSMNPPWYENAWMVDRFRRDRELTNAHTFEVWKTQIASRIQPTGA